MRRALLAVLLILITGAASAQHSNPVMRTPWNPQKGVGGVAPPSFVGPCGDLIAHNLTIVCYATRALNAFVASHAGGLVNITRTSDSHNCDVLAATDGNMGALANCTTPADDGGDPETWCTATECDVMIWYDQANNNHAVPIGAPPGFLYPYLVFNATVTGKPCVRFPTPSPGPPFSAMNTASPVVTGSGGGAPFLPITVTYTAESEFADGSHVSQTLYTMGPARVQALFNVYHSGLHPPANFGMNNGIDLWTNGLAYTLNQYHQVANVFVGDGTSDQVWVDGTNPVSSGNSGTTGPPPAYVGIGGRSGGAVTWWYGNICEVESFITQMSAPDILAVGLNQQAWWGN